MKPFTYVLPALAAIVMSGCSADTDFSQENLNQDGKAVLVFNSGFENGTVGTENQSGNDYLNGVDNSVPEPNDWTMFRTGYPGLGKFTIQYEGGDPTERYARIVEDPTNPANKVLMFKIISPNVRNDAGNVYKSRVQANVSQGNIREFSQSIRLYLHPDMQFLETMPEKISFLILMEWWNDAPATNRPYVSRISLRMSKETTGNEKLRLLLDSQDIEYVNNEATFHTRWESRAENFDIPYGRWMTIEYYIKEGDANTGAFCMAITPDGGQKQVLFDIKGATHGTGNPNPTGFFFNPMKFYTSVPITNYMKDNDKSFQIYWDDFKLWSGKRQFVSNIGL